MSDDTKPAREMKIWIVVRTDHAISAMKLGVQIGHAFEWLTRLLMQEHQDLYREYLETGTGGTPKIGVRAKSEAELRKAVAAAEAAGIPVVLVEDEGRTEFGGVKTTTVAAFGPAYRDELPPYLKRLQLLETEKVVFK